MIVEKPDYLASLKGSIDKDKYARSIPGNDRKAAVCYKPKYSKAAQKEMAKRPGVVRFKAMMEEVKTIMADPEKKAQWQQKYTKALREASRHQRKPDANGKPYVPARLYDYIRRELMREANKN